MALTPDEINYLKSNNIPREQAPQALIEYRQSKTQRATEKAQADTYKNPLKTVLPDFGENLKGIPLGLASTGAMIGRDIFRGGRALFTGGSVESETEKMIRSIPKAYAEKYWGDMPKVTGNMALDIYNALMPKRAAKEFSQHPISTLMDISTVAGAGAGVAGLAGKTAKILGASEAAIRSAKVASALRNVEKFSNVPGLFTQGVIGGARALTSAKFIDPAKVNALKAAGEVEGTTFKETGNIIKTTDKKSLYLKNMSDSLNNMRNEMAGDKPISKIVEGQSGHLQESQKAMDKLEREYYNDAFKEAAIAGGTTGTQGNLPKFKSATEVKIKLPTTINKIDELLTYEKAKGSASINKKAVKFLKEFKQDISKPLTYDKSQSIQNALGKIDWADADAAELTGYKKKIWGTMKAERVDQLDKLAPGFKTKLQAADAVFKSHQSEIINDIVKSFNKLAQEKDFKGAMAHLIDPTMDRELATMVKQRMGGNVDMAKAYIINDIAEKASVDGVINYNKLRNGINKWSGISDVYFNQAEITKLKDLENTAKVLQGYEKIPNGKMLYRRALIGMVGANKFIDTPLGKSFLEQAVHDYKYIKQIAPSARDQDNE